MLPEDQIKIEENNSLADLSDDSDSLVGQCIGKYEIVREIGAGGMGAVYLARRADGIFRKKVALKIIKRGIDTKLIRQRFRQERQVLALLNHPYIAPLLDGGTTDDGLPYFIMDFVEGDSLYKYCNDRRLSISERLRLFSGICEAVEYAHQQNVIHRDLKPSNILIKPDGTPRLLDFGIAKVFNPDLQLDTHVDPTATDMRMMTPEYASPEQIKGEPVTPASDIYSLGVVLYELLTGHRPYRFKNRAPHEISRVICEELPKPLSESLTDEDNFAPTGDNSQKIMAETIFSARSTTHERLRQELSGDLNKIILKTLRKDSFERYDSTAAMAEDITRFLKKQPVKAKSFPVISIKPELNPKRLFEKYSVAVLPLTVIGPADPQNTGEIYLGIGLADALISRLAQIPRFVVRPTSSVLHFQKQAKSGFDIGQELGVRFIVEGTVRRAGERVRVSIQLLSIEDSSTLWAEMFDEKFTDVLELEDSISERVAKSLLPKLTGEEEKQLHKRGTNSPEAYEAFLRGRYFANQFDDEALPKAIEAYREAVRIDPHYALPYVGIADFYVMSAIFGAMPTHEAYPLAKKELSAALEADESLAEAYALLAFIALLYDWDWQEAERLVRRALEISPNYHIAHDVKAHILASQGVSRLAISEIKYSERLDPLSPRSKLMTSCIFYQCRRFDEGAAKAEEALLMQENSSHAFLQFGNSLIHTANNKKAIEALQASSNFWEGSALPKYMLCFALMADNQEMEARKVLKSILLIAKREFVKPYFVAMAYTALGENELAFEWFEKSIEARDDWMLWFGTDIKIEPLREDPRYFEILRKTNNPIHIEGK